MEEQKKPGKAVREFTRVLKEQIEDKAKIDLKSDDLSLIHI